MSTEKKKSLFHSELRSLSPLTVKVVKERQESKYKKGQEYVVLEIDGEERTYNAENPECAAAFDGYEGKVITIDADGGGKGKEETASITVDADSVENAPRQQQSRPKGALPPKPAARQEINEPPPEEESHAPTPPPQRQADRKPSLKQRALQVANLHLVALAAAKAEAEQSVIQLGWQPTDDQIAAVAMNITIQLEHEKAYWEMPNNAWVDVRPKQKPAPVAAE